MFLPINGNSLLPVNGTYSVFLCHTRRRRAASKADIVTHIDTYLSRGRECEYIPGSYTFF